MSATASPLPHASLQGTVSVVTGGSSGIGAAIAIGLGGAGSQVVIAGRSHGRLDETRARGRDAGVHLETEVVDVGSPPGLEDFAHRVVARYGRPTVLVNSAGNSLVKPAMDVTVAEWDELHSAHVRGTFLACQLFGRAMAENGYGKIINLSSTWASTVGRGRSVYAAAKAAVSHLTAALAVEWGELGIRVNAIAPTATRSPSREQQFAADPQREQWLLSRIPLGRLATPEDMVGAALFLAGPASDFVTGHTLYVDGGWQHSK